MHDHVLVLVGHVAVEVEEADLVGLFREELLDVDVRVSMILGDCNALSSFRPGDECALGVLGD